MAKGRKRTPLKVLQAKGSQWANPDYNCAYRINEPDPKIEAPKRPRWLSKRARQVWKEKVKELINMGVLAKIDGSALACYCESYARFEDAAKSIQKFEYYESVDKHGGKVIRQNPAAKVYNDMRQILARLESDFGLSPTGRTRIKIEKPKKVENEIEEFLNEQN